MEQDLNKVIDYILKLDIEIPKIISTLVQLLPDKEMSNSIRKILEGDK